MTLMRPFCSLWARANTEMCYCSEVCLRLTRSASTFYLAIAHQQLKTNEIKKKEVEM